MSKEVFDPSALTMSIDLIYRKSKLIKQLYEQREKKKQLSFAEAKKLVLDDLKDTLAQAKVSSHATGWAGKVGAAKASLLNTYVPLIQKFIPEEHATVSYKIDRDISDARTKGAMCEYLMPILYTLIAAIDDLAKFGE